MRTTKRTVPAILLLLVLPLTAALAQTSDIPARKPVRLEGTVISERDHPLIGTSVLAQPAAEPSTFHLTSTDRKGNFRIDNVPEGRYRLEFLHERFLPVVKEGVETRHPFRAVIEITMPRGQEPAAGGAGESEPGSTVKFSGRVTSGDGKAIHGRSQAPPGRDPEDTVRMGLSGDGAALGRIPEHEGTGAFGPERPRRGEAYCLSPGGASYAFRAQDRTSPGRVRSSAATRHRGRRSESDAMAARVSREQISPSWQGSKERARRRPGGRRTSDAMNNAARAEKALLTDPG